MNTNTNTNAASDYYATAYRTLAAGRQDMRFNGETIHIDLESFLPDGSITDYTEAEFVAMCLDCYGNEPRGLSNNR